MKRSILTVTLNPAIDKMIWLSGPRTGHEHRAEKITLSAGGKGINVSRALTILGEPNLAIGIAGGRTGDHLADMLCKENIEADFLHIKDEARTNLTMIDPHTHLITRVIENGPHVDRKDLKAFKAKFKSHLRGASYVIFSGSNAYGVGDSIYGDLIREAHEKGVRTVLDARGKPLAEGIKARPFILKPNLEEAEELLGKKLDSLTKIKKAVFFLAGQGIAHVIITMGHKGAVAYDGCEMMHVVSPGVKQVNNVGCGDVFLASYVASLQRGRSFRDALKLAAAVGAANTLTGQPGAFLMGVVRRFMQKIKITRI